MAHWAHKHGHNTDGPSPTYNSWQAMKQRCDSPNQDNSHNYHGRGITYDPRWSEFAEFLADMGERPDGTSLERKDGDGNYNKDNCVWATPTEQARNRVSTKLTLEDAVDIVLRRWSNEKLQDVADMYGVSKSRVSEIVSGKSWPEAIELAEPRHQQRIGWHDC